MPKINETVHTADGSFLKGDDVPAGHPLVKLAPHLFDTRDDSPRVEDASATPGRKRNR